MDVGAYGSSGAIAVPFVEPAPPCGTALAPPLSHSITVNCARARSKSKRFVTLTSARVKTVVTKIGSSKAFFFFTS